MTILIIDNAAIIKRGSDYYVYQTTGKFGADLKGLGNSIEYFQLHTETSRTINTFKLSTFDLNVTSVKIFKSKCLTYFIAYLIGFWRILHNDFIYFFFPSSFKFLALAAILFNKRFGLFIRGDVGFHNRITLALYKRAFAIFTVTRSYSETINNLFKKEKAFCIRPMLSFTRHDIIEDRKYYLNGVVQLLYLGRIERDKGVFELLESIREIRKRCSFKFKLTYVGDGPDYDNLAMSIKAQGTQDLVDLAGPINNRDLIKEKYLQANIYICPSYHEGFPRTLYEAMIFGTPIITTFVGGISDIMVDGFNCYRIEVKSVSSITERVINVISHYEKVSVIVKNATETIKRILNDDSPSHAEHLNMIIKNCNYHVKQILE